MEYFFLDYSNQNPTKFLRGNSIMDSNFIVIYYILIFFLLLEYYLFFLIDKKVEYFFQ